MQTVWNWMVRHSRAVWSVVLGIVALVIFCSTYDANMPLGTVGEWSWAHHTPIMLAFGAAFIIVWINQARWGRLAARNIRLMLTGMLVLIFGIAPVVGWFSGSKSAATLPTTAAQAPALPQDAPVPLASSPVSEWPKLTIPAGGDRHSSPFLTE